MSGVTINIDDTELLRKLGRAEADAFGYGARQLTSRAIANVAKHKLARPGGYHKTPGAMQQQIHTGPTQARGEPAGSVVLEFPGFQVEFGTRRSKPLRFLKKAQRQLRADVHRAIKDKI